MIQRGCLHVPDPLEITPYLYNVAKLHLWHFFFFRKKCSIRQVGGGKKMEERKNPFTESHDHTGQSRIWKGNPWVQRCKKNFRRKLYPLPWIQPTGIEEMPKKNRIDWKRPGRLVSGVFTFYLIWR